MAFTLDKEEEIGRLVRQDNADIVVRKTTYKGQEFIDIRLWLKGTDYTGWSKMGLSIKADELPELIKLLKRIK